MTHGQRASTLEEFMKDTNGIFWEGKKINMPINIELRLRETMSDMLAVRRLTENGSDEEALWEELFNHLREEGLAEIQVEDGKPILVAAERFKRSFSNNRSDLFELMCSGVVEEAIFAQLTGSLSIILAECVDRARKEQCDAGRDPEKITADLVLLVLAGTGKARLMLKNNDEMVWMPSPELFAEYNDDIIVNARAGGMRMDDTLKALAKDYYVANKLSPKEFKMSELVRYSMMQIFEIRGSAIAYRDCDGALAWKATEELQKKFADAKNKRCKKRRGIA
jgi:hypothetical protein